MARKKHRVEQVINKLREAEVELAKGQTVRAACRKLGVSEHTYYRWRKEYGGLKLNRGRLNAADIGRRIRIRERRVRQISVTSWFATRHSARLSAYPTRACGAAGSAVCP